MYTHSPGWVHTRRDGERERAGHSAWVQPWRTWVPGIVLAFLAGMVLPVWWLTSVHPRGVAGLGAYPSAWLGDPMLLPGGLLVLVIGIRKLPPAQRERVFARDGALVAAVISVIMQAMWYADPTTRRNWTRPRPGDFDMAGWWHAVYFTAMSGLLVGLVVMFLARVRAGRLAGDPAVAAVSSGRGAVLLFTAWGAYAALAVHDDFSGPGFTGTLTRSAATNVALVGATVAVAAFLVAAAYGRLTAVLGRPALAAAGGATLIVCLVTQPAAAGAAIGVPAAVMGGLAAAVGRSPALFHCERHD
jgi:hypothetical protein